MSDRDGLSQIQMRRARAEIAAVETADEESRAATLDFCATHPDALERRCLEGHLTGSALVVEPASRQVLLLHHAKLGRWLQPGGHADGDGDLGAVALREATEETGLAGLRLVRPAIDLDIHEIPARGAEPGHLHHDVRYLVLAPDRRHRINDESTAARWLDADAPELGTGELARLVAAGMARVDELGRLGELGRFGGPGQPED